MLSATSSSSSIINMRFIFYLLWDCYHECAAFSGSGPILQFPAHPFDDLVGYGQSDAGARRIVTLLEEHREEFRPVLGLYADTGIRDADDHVGFIVRPGHSDIAFFSEFDRIADQVAHDHRKEALIAPYIDVRSAHAQIEPPGFRERLVFAAYRPHHIIDREPLGHHLDRIQFRELHYLVYRAAKAQCIAKHQTVGRSGF